MKQNLMQIRCSFTSVILTGRYDRKTAITRRHKNTQKKHKRLHRRTPLGRKVHRRVQFAIPSGTQLYYKQIHKLSPVISHQTLLKLCSFLKSTDEVLQKFLHATKTLAIKTLMCDTKLCFVDIHKLKSHRTDLQFIRKKYYVTCFGTGNFPLRIKHVAYIGAITFIYIYIYIFFPVMVQKPLAGKGLLTVEASR